MTGGGGLYEAYREPPRDRKSGPAENEVTSGAKSGTASQAWCQETTPAPCPWWHHCSKGARFAALGDECWGDDEPEEDGASANEGS